MENGRDGGHGHTQPSFGKLSSSSMVVISIHSLPLESSPPLLDRSFPLYSGKVVVYWADSEPYPYKLSSSFGKGKGWWSWSYTAFLWRALLLFLEREGVVVMVIQGFLFKSLSAGKGKGWCAGLVQIVQEEEDNLLEETCV